MPMASTLPCRATISARRHRRRHHQADASGGARTGRLGRPLVISGHSAGGHLAACMLATDWRGARCVAAEGPGDRRVRDFGPVRPRAAGRHLHQQGAGARRRVGRGRQAPCSGNRRRTAASMPWSAATKARNILPAEPDHRDAWAAAAWRPVSARFPTPIILPRSRRWPIRLAHGAAAEGTGRALNARSGKAELQRFSDKIMPKQPVD